MGFGNDLLPLTSHPTEIWPVPPVRKEEKSGRSEQSTWDQEINKDEEENVPEEQGLM